MTARFFQEILSLYLRMAPYLVFGMIISGVLSVVMKKESITQHIGRDSFSSAVKASLFGVPLPLCSCSVIPTALYLRDNGASRSAVTGFLISTPQTGVDSIAASYGMMGPLMAVYRPVSAFLLGAVGGALSMLFPQEYQEAVPEAPSCSDHCCSCSHEHESSAVALHPLERIKAAFRYGFLDFIDDIGGHFLFGLLLAGIMGILIPDDFFQGSIIGSGVVGMLTMTVVGIPMYICSTSSIPIAVMLITKGASLGTAFVFLLAGPATNLATLAVLSRKMGKAFSVMYTGILVVGSILFGLLLDLLIAVFPQLASLVTFGDLAADHTDPGIIMLSSSLLLTLLLLRSFGKRILARVRK